jgi:hypothetical protein
LKKSDLLLLGAGAVLAYVLYKKATAVTQAAGAAYTGSVNTVSDWISSLFGPSATAAGATYYTVVFEDGTSHAVPASSVSNTGVFTWTGYPAGSQPAQQLSLLVGSDGTKYAVSDG